MDSQVAEFWYQLSSLIASKQLKRAEKNYRENAHVVGPENSEVYDSEVHGLLQNRLRKLHEDKISLEKLINSNKHAQALELIESIREYCIDDDFVNTSNVGSGIGASKQAQLRGDDAFGGLMLPKPRFMLLELGLVAIAILLIGSAIVPVSTAMGGSEVLTGAKSWSGHTLKFCIPILALAYVAAGTPAALWNFGLPRQLSLSKLHGVRLVCLILIGTFLFFLLGGYLMAFVFFGFGPGITEKWVPSLIATIACLILILLFARRVAAQKAVLAWNAFVDEAARVVSTGEQFGVLKIESSPTVFKANGARTALFEADARFVLPRPEKIKVRLKKESFLAPTSGTWLVIDDNSQIRLLLTDRQVRMAHKFSKRDYPVL